MQDHQKCTRTHQLMMQLTSQTSILVTTVTKLCYLGSTISRDCKDTLDLIHRIRKAGNAFGALKKSIFSSRRISDSAKSSAYQSLILPILLYGAESWCLTESFLRQLRNFHHSCLRAMCGINRTQVFEYHISTEQLLARLSLNLIEHYVFKRQLSWLGHTARMPFERLPRKLLSSWVFNRRPRGSPEFTYGRGIYKALGWFSIDKKRWYEMVFDRGGWRELFNV